MNSVKALRRLHQLLWNSFEIRVIRVIPQFNIAIIAIEDDQKHLIDSLMHRYYLECDRGVVKLQLRLNGFLFNSVS